MGARSSRPRPVHLQLRRLETECDHQRYQQSLDTTVQGVQIAITVFLLVMVALMIPGGSWPTAMAGSGASPLAPVRHAISGG